MMERLAIEAFGEVDGGAVVHTKPAMNSVEHLIARARRGDEEAFRLIFERYSRPIISFIYDMIGDRAHAEELTQETFVRAHRHLSALREEAKFSTWLFSIAKNVARESLRTDGIAPAHTALSGGEGMKCQEVSALLEEYFDGELADGQSRAVAAHLS